MVNVFSLSSVSFRNVRSAGEGRARGVVISWPDGPLALCLLRSHWGTAHNGETSSTYQDAIVFLFFFLSQYLIISHHSHTCGNAIIGLWYKTLTKNVSYHKTAAHFADLEENNVRNT